MQPSFLALGDSYTIGESIPQSERWPVQLARALRKKGVKIAEPVIIAQTGWTTDELLTAIKQTHLHPPYDLVTLLIGVNNQYRGYNLDAYQKEFKKLCHQAIELAGNKPPHVLVLSIPDWGVTPFAQGRNPHQIAQEIDAFNQVNRKLSQQLGVHHVDITPISREHPEQIAPDGLHPSGGMYRLWVEEVIKVVSFAFLMDN